MAQKMYVDVNEIMKDWGCSRAKGYQIIAELNAQLLKMNPHSIIIQGKPNGLQEYVDAMNEFN